jgi:hypothetical protein
MNTDLRWMLSSDQQIPFHDPRAIDLWFKVMKWYKPDVVDYLGDTSDQACFSTFNEGRAGEFLNDIKKGVVDDLFPFVESEERPVREFYEKTRKMLPNAELFSALGNHDIRVFNYLDKKAPEISKDATPESLWGLDSLGIGYIYYDELPKHRYGDIYVHHGISALKTPGDSVRSDVNELGVSLVRGHSHKASSYYKTMELRNETLRGLEIGHLCDVKSDGFKYTNVRNWQQGFAVAYIESGCSWTKDGYWPHLQFIHISPEYTCVVDGKKFSA